MAVFRSVFVLLATWISTIYSMVYLAPPTSSKASQLAVLIYFPGANVPSEKYSPLLAHIQEEFHAKSIELHAAVLTYSSIGNVQLPPFIQTEKQVKNALKEIKEKYQIKPRPDQIILAGHSLGGVLAQNVAFNKPESYGSLWLHGSFLQNKFQKSQLKLPTLTLTGSRDGLNRLSYVAMQYNSMISKYASTNAVAMDAPTVVLDGVNHIQFCDDFTNDYLTQHDLPSTVSLSQAFSQIGHLTTAFWDQVQTKVVESALVQAVEQSTRDFYNPFVKSFQADTSGETCAELQALIFDQEAETRIIKANLPYTKMISFIWTKPKVTDTHVFVETFVSQESNLIGTSLVPYGVKTMRCKMKTKEAVYGVPSKAFDTCADLNRALVDKVLHSLPESYQQAYNNSTRKISFGEDIVYETGINWSRNDLSLTQGAAGLKAQCARLKTAPGTGRYDGMFYCALVSASRAYEHILIDSFKN